MILGRRKADLFSQGSHKWTSIGGAAMSKKHAFGREAAENYLRFARISPGNMIAHLHVKDGGVDRAYLQKRKPGRSKIALVQLTYTCTQMCRVRLGWSGGMLPQEKVLKI